MKTSWLSALAIASIIFPHTGRAFPSATQKPGLVGALPRAHSALTYQRRAVESLLGGAPPVVDSLKTIVFLVSFEDRTFGAGHGPAYFENELRHLREYYAGASNGKFFLTTDLDTTIVVLSGVEAYYGDNELWKERMAELLIELVQKTDSRVDFSRYDAFAMIHAGAGDETDFNGDSPEQVSSGFVDPEELAEALEDTLGTPGVATNDSVGGEPFQITSLMIWPEEASQDGYVFGSLGLYAYQVGLRLGMIPLYDTTPGDFPDSQGIGSFDLMGYGIYNAAGFVPAFPSAFNRYLMGWAVPVVVDRDGVVRIAAAGTAASTDTSLVKLPINASEYYLIENRVHDTDFDGAFDFGDVDTNGVPDNADILQGAEFDFFLTETTNLRIVRPGVRDSILTGSGLMIYHVDEYVLARALEAGGHANDDVRWKGVDIEEADHVQDLDTPEGSFAYGSYYDSFRSGNNDRFGDGTDPSSLSNGGAHTGIEIDAVSAAGHIMSFRVRFSPPVASTRSEFAGAIARSSPVPADLDGDGVEELVVAADTGLVYVVRDAGEAGWAGEIDLIFDADSAVWSGPPVVADLDGDGSPEIFLTSRDGTLFALESSGAPLAIDTDATPGTLELRGDRAAAPMAFDFDVSDPEPEIIALSSTADSTYVCVVGFIGVLPGLGEGTGGPLWIHRGNAVEIGLLEGQIVSHPARARWEDAGAVNEGFCIALRSGDSPFRFQYVLLKVDGDPTLETGYSRRLFEYSYESEELLVPASGDVDLDGADETVFSIRGQGGHTPGQGIHYVSPRGTWTPSKLRGDRISASALADIDGDGTLETALRDEGHLYLFSGFGTPVSGWPIALADAVAAHDRTDLQPSPVIGDVDGDGRSDIVFRVGGDLQAFDFHGRRLEGWPLSGEGTAEGALALLKGAGNALYLFDSAALVPYSGTGAVSALRRYDPGCDYLGIEMWPMSRHDAGGSSRQAPSAGENPLEAHVDESSFIIYPNPVKGAAFTVRVLISAPARIKTSIVNMEGEQVDEEIRRHDWFEGSAVPFEAAFRAGKLASGVYLCRVEVTGEGWNWIGTKKFAVTR